MTRRRIVAAARKEFVKKGYAKATIDEIIVAAGLSRRPCTCTSI